jgi:hypothetical protein
MGRASGSAGCRRCGPLLGGFDRPLAIPVGGAKGQTRTADRTIFSRELYQLSYLGAGQSPDRWAIEGSNL